MLANLSLTSVTTVLVYMSVSLLERFPVIPCCNSSICGAVGTILRKIRLTTHLRISRWENSGFSKNFSALLFLVLSQLAEGLTIMRISMDRIRCVRRPLEREDWGDVQRKITFIWIV